MATTASEPAAPAPPGAPGASTTVYTAPPPLPQPPQSPPLAATDDPFDSLLTLEDQFYTQGYNEGLADGVAAGRAEGRQLGLERGFQKFVESGRLQGRAIVWANRLKQQPGRRRQQEQEGSGESGPASSPSSAGDLPSGPASISQSQNAGGSSSSPLEAKAEVPSIGVDAGSGDVGIGAASRGIDDPEAEQEPPDARPIPPSLHLPPLPDNPRLAKHISTLYALAETESLSTDNTDEAVDDFDDRLRRAQGRAKVIERMVGEGGAIGAGPEKQRDAGGQGHDPGPGREEGKVGGGDV